VFAFSRPNHVRSCLAALADANLARESDIFVFIDGPTSKASAATTRAVHEVVTAMHDRFASLTIVARERNLGLAASIVDGVTRLVTDRGRVIVVEDDLIVAPRFLEYMNWALDTLADEPRVGSIHGYCFRGLLLNEPYYYMKGGDCWGWATWKDRWDLFEPDGRSLLKALIRKRCLFEFTLGFAAPYCRLLCAQILGQNNSWAIRWHASLFLHDRLTLYPTASLVQNIGLDGSGENCGDIRIYDTDIVAHGAALPTILPLPLPSDRAREHFVTVYSGGRRGLYRLAWRGLSMIFDLYCILRVKLTP
jgi:hypothetical protein